MKLKINFLSLSLVGFLMFSCAIQSERLEQLSSSQVATSSNDAAEKQKTVLNQDIKKNEKYTLAEDRQSFEKLREHVPIEQRIKNDEKSLYLNWMSNYRLSPMEIREKFTNLLRNKREIFNNDIDLVRKDFRKAQELSKKDFLTKLDEDKQNIKQLKTTRERQNELIAELETKRKEYFSVVRQDADIFETEIRSKRKEFEDYLKEKTDEFNFELKEYTIKYSDIQKIKKLNDQE